MEANKWLDLSSTITSFVARLLKVVRYQPIELAAQSIRLATSDICHFIYPLASELLITSTGNTLNASVLLRERKISANFVTELKISEKESSDWVR